MSKDELDKIKKLPYHLLIGCLLYLSISMHPDITYSIQQLSQYLDCYSYADTPSVRKSSLQDWKYT